MAVLMLMLIKKNQTAPTLSAAECAEVICPQKWPVMAGQAVTYIQTLSI